MSKGVTELLKCSYLVQEVGLLAWWGSDSQSTAESFCNFPKLTGSTNEQPIFACNSKGLWVVDHYLRPISTNIHPSPIFLESPTITPL